MLMVKQLRAMSTHPFPIKLMGLLCNSPQRAANGQLRLGPAHGNRPALIYMPGGMAVGRFVVTGRRRTWGLLIIVVMVPLLAVGYWVWPTIQAGMERVIRAAAV